jgi:hypothetical protein
MRLKLTFLLAIIFLGYRSQAQNIQWARKDTSSFTTQKFVCVNNSSVYLYGTNDNATGSFLMKYTAQGTQTLMKTWPGNFNLTKIIYDGNQSFYFTANYMGNMTVDGIPLVGRGGYDGAVGKMTLNGTIQWMSTIASAAEEKANWLCFGPGNNSIVASGKTTDSLIVNGVYVNKSTQSALIAEFSLTGSLQNSRLWDFLPQRDNHFGTETGLENEGFDIYLTTGGNYYLLVSREGKHPPCCSSDTLNAPLEGFYVTKLNATWDTLWTTYITGPQCYYGFSCGGLAASSNGDAYIISSCSSQYGGTGILWRLNQNTGVASWTDSHSDGGYQWIVAKGDTIFSCGTDSATYCPCPNQNSGFQTLKVFDQSNTMTHIEKFDQAQYVNASLEFMGLDRDDYSHTYVLGSFMSSSLVLGNDTIQGDFVNSGYYTRFLMKLSDTTFSTYVLVNNLLPFNVYPNPSVSGLFTVNTEDISADPLSVLVTGVNGQVTHRETIPASSKTYILDLSKCSKGFYMLELSNGKETWRKKIILQ